MATSVRPCRQGRPKVSETITPTRTPSRSRSPRRMRPAEASGSSGSSSTVPGEVLEASTPAAAITKPCRVCAMTVSPRRATTRAVSSSIAAVRLSRCVVSLALCLIRPSALLTILEVTTRMSPSRRSGAACATSRATSSPGRTSGRPGTPLTVIWGMCSSAICVRTSATGPG